MREIFHADGILQWYPTVYSSQATGCSSRQQDIHIVFAQLHTTTIERDIEQAIIIIITLQRNTDTPHVSSKLSSHAVPHVNRTRSCCHSPMHHDSVRTHALS